MIPWTEEEDIALATSWLATLTNNVPREPTAPFWEQILQQFCIHVRGGGDTTRTVNAISSRFKTIHLKSSRFEMIFNAIENDDGELTEDDVIQVALVDYKIRTACL
ncbi:hypothetical protein Hanom_Chr07g00656811 [Helianthus anomalus]